MNSLNQFLNIGVLMIMQQKLFIILLSATKI